MEPVFRPSLSKATAPKDAQKEFDVDAEIQPMPKHVFLNTLPGNLAPFPQINRTKFQSGEHTEYFGQESLLNNFIASHCTDFKVPPHMKAFKRKSTSLLGEQDKDANSEEEETEQLAPEAAAVSKTGRGKHQCSFCRRIFSNGSNLKTHMRMHTGVKPYKCRYCEKTSATQSNIATHERTHTGVRPFTCDVCGNEYSTSSNLKTHRRIHFDVRPFTCRMCGKGFCSSSNLITHLRAHWGLRLYHCTTCGKQFSTSSNLTVHVRITHLALRPFTCAICGKDFSTGGNLVAHLRSHPEGSPNMLSQPELEMTNPSDLGYITLTTPEALKSVNAGMLKPSDYNIDSNALLTPIPTRAGPLPMQPPRSPPTPQSERDRKYARVSVYQPSDVPLFTLASLQTPSPHYPQAPAGETSNTSWDYNKLEVASNVDRIEQVNIFPSRVTSDEIKTEHPL